MARKTTVRELHLKTSGILTEVSDGETFIVEKRGVPIAELRPVSRVRTSRRLPDREALIKHMPSVDTDSGTILEEDRI